MNIKEYIKKLDGKKLVILSILALGIDEGIKSIMNFIVSKSVTYSFIGLSQQLFFCFNLALPIYFIIILSTLFILDRKILVIYYDKYHRTFLWILLLLITILTIVIYLYIFSQTEYTLQNFEQFKSSICIS